MIMTDKQIQYMVNRFLAWRLPKDFNPDNGISVQRPNYVPNVEWELIGTNLFDAAQAEAMVRHVVEGMALGEGSLLPQTGGLVYRAICQDITNIMQTYDEQMDAHGYVDTPGGLEHMGDVWRLLDRWRHMIVSSDAYDSNEGK